MHELQVDNVLWFFIGAGLGLAAGWSLQAMRYARRAAEGVEDMRDDDGRIDGRSLGLGLMVALVGTAAVLSGISAQQSDRANDRLDSLATCNQDILERTIRALNERTAFSDEQAAARRQVLTTQRDLVQTLMEPNAQPNVQLRAARDYRAAVVQQIRADNRNAQRRNAFPYPTPQQIRECK